MFILVRVTLCVIFLLYSIFFIFLILFFYVVTCKTPRFWLGKSRGFLNFLCKNENILFSSAVFLFVNVERKGRINVMFLSVVLESLCCILVIVSVFSLCRINVVILNVDCYVYTL